MHEGFTGRSGHYIAYVKDDGGWFELDDEKVTNLQVEAWKWRINVICFKGDKNRFLRSKKEAGILVGLCKNCGKL